MGTEREEEKDVKGPSAPVDGASSDARQQDRADLRRLRGSKRSAVTRACKHGSSEGDFMLKRRELYHSKGCDMGS